MPDPEQLSHVRSAAKNRATRPTSMYIAVAAIALAGIVAFGALMIYAARRTMYREHYVFRERVRPGEAEREIRTQFGAPDQTYWTKRSLMHVISGYGIYESFDRDISPADLDDDFQKALCYQTTDRHGDFVVINTDGNATLVFTGHVRPENR